MNRLKQKYQKEIVPKLKEDFDIKNSLAVPKMTKIVINVGAGDAKDSETLLDKIMASLTVISGQKPVAARAKKSISGFKISKGQTVGAMVTLRGERMYEFLDKLVTIVLPKVRDFRGISNKSFDNQGNFSLGIAEADIFPEIGFEGSGSGTKMRGLEISIVTTSKNPEQGKKLLELLGMPFKKD